MNCPKCSGGAYLSDEDVVKVVENVSPQVVIMKQTWICRACAERFGRLKSTDTSSLSGIPDVMPIQLTDSGPQSRAAHSPAGIHFLDNL